MSTTQDHLAAELAAADAQLSNEIAPPEQLPEGQPAPVIDPAAAVRAILTVAVRMLALPFPSLREVYTPQTIEGVAAVAGALALKRGWTISSGRFAEEIAFASDVLPVGYRTYRAIEYDLEARKAANDAKKPVTVREPEPPKRTAESGGAGFSTSTGQ